jgi:hypothetical protein
LLAPVPTTVPPKGLRLVGPEFAVPSVEGVPQTLDELGELESSTYDLGVTSALKVSIPVVGSISGGADRRVVVYEWTRFKQIPDAGGVLYRYGYVARFCLTVSKWNVGMSVSMPFLAAQAELGTVQASWLMQVRGLVGKAIDRVVLPPQALKVETFVLAAQSLEAVVSAIHDPSTRFVPEVLLAVIDPSSPEHEYWLASVKAFALHSISRGRTCEEAQARLSTTDLAALEAVRDVYTALGVAGATSPNEDSRQKARDILRGIRADI